MWLKHIALPVVFGALTVSAASGQTQQQAEPYLEQVVKPGMTVWITDSSAKEEKRHVVGVSADSVTAADGEDVRRFSATDISRIRVRQSDSLINGALIGAGAAIGSGLLLCGLTETWANCRDDAGPMFRIGAIGAGAGIAIDALIRERKTIYPAAPGSTALHAWPLIDRHTKGLQVSLSF